MANDNFSLKAIILGEDPVATRNALKEAAAAKAKAEEAEAAAAAAKALEEGLEPPPPKKVEPEKKV